MPFTVSDDTFVNEEIQGDQLNPQIIQLADGRILVTWQSADPDLDGSGTAISARIGTPQPDGSILWSDAGEFLVNQETENAQTVPQVTQLPDGRLVFVYTTADPNIDGSSTGIAIRVGTPQPDGSILWSGAGEFSVNGHQTNAQEIQQIVTLSDGRVMVTWHTADPSIDGNVDAVSARIGTINADGSVTWTAEFAVNEEVTGSQSNVNVIELADGRLMFTWQSADADVDGNGTGISVRVGTPQANGSITWGAAGEVTVNAEISNNQTAPQLTQLADGRVLLTWQSGDPDSAGISARVGTVQANGSVVWGAAGEFSVNTATGAGSVGAPDVIQAADGTIIFTWADSHADVDGDGYGIAARAGTVQANGSITWLTDEQIRIDLHGAGDQLTPHLTTLSNGNVVIVWSSASADGSGAGIVVQTVLFGPNTAPVAQDDAFAIGEFGSTSGNLLGDNGAGVDSDANFDALSVSAVNGVGANVGNQITLASGALVTVNADGTFSYNANGAFEQLAVGETDTDTFTYTVSDGHGGTDTATVTITLSGANDGPTAHHDAVSVGENATLNGSVLSDNGSGADSDIDATDTLTVSAVNGIGASVGNQITLASGALLTVNANGTFSYNTNGAFDSLGAGETDTDSFTYTISDGHGGTSTATATVTINGANDAPVAQDDAFSTDQNTNVAGNLFGDNGSGADSDVDASDSFTITSMSVGTLGVFVPVIGGGELRVNADGTFTFQPGDAYDGLSAGESVDRSFTYTIEDGHGVTSTATATITINGLNDGPVARADAFTSDEDALLSGGVFGDNGAGADSDADISDSFTVTAVNGSALSVGTQITLASGALLTLNADGTFSYDQNGAFDSLGVGAGDNDSFSYTITDGHGATSTATATITIDGVNDAPVAQDDDFHTDEATDLGSGLFGGIGLGPDSDVDAGDVITVVSSSAGPLGVFVPVSGGGELQVNANGTFTFRPNGSYGWLGATESVTRTFTYTISDGNGGTDTATASITIHGINDAPAAQNDAFSTDEASPISGNVLADNGAGADSDIDANDVLTISEVNGVGASVGNQITLASGALLTLNADGTFDYDPNGAFEHLGVGESTTDSFNYTTWDGRSGADTATVTLTINGVNDAPVAHADAISTDEGSPVSGSVLANNGSGADSDADVTDTLTVTEVNGVGASVGNQIALASGALLTLNADGAFDYDPNGAFESLAVGESDTDSFTYTISDGHGGTSTATATVTINGVNDAPVAQADAFTTDNWTATTGNVLADNGSGADSDVDASDALTVVAINGVAMSVGSQIMLASGALLTLNANGAFAYDPNDAFDLGLDEVTTDSFTYTTGDGHGGESTATATITVTSVHQTLTGTGGDDTLFGLLGNDVLVGLEGADTLDGGLGADALDGGDGTDTASYANAAAGVTANLASPGANMGEAAGDTYTGVENIIGSGYNDTLAGDGGDNRLDGGHASDTLVEGAGNDTMIGGGGTDTIDASAVGGAYNLDLTLAGGWQVTGAAAGSVWVESIENVIGGAFGDAVTGNDSNNMLLGGIGNDVLVGNGGDDVLNGGADIDAMTGGEGNDTYFIENAGDTVHENADEGVDTVHSAFTYTLGANFENLTLTGASAINGRGNSANNTIIGNGSANSLSGFDGNDVLDGGAGADNMFGAQGDDTYYVDNAGDVVIEAQAVWGTDLVYSSITFTLGANIDNLTLIGSSNIRGNGNADANVITGNSGINVLYGFAGNDTLSGGAGADKMYGGEGNDSYYIDNAADFLFEAQFAWGTDTAYSSVSYELGLNIDNLVLQAGAGNIFGRGNDLNNAITGNESNNNLYGFQGNDVLNGGAGADKMYGQQGDDTYYVDNVGDIAFEAQGAWGTDTVFSSVTFELGANLDNLVLTGSGAINGRGNADANVLTGNGEANRLNGLLGNDTLIGGLGTDVLIGSGGDDKFVFSLGDGDDTINDFVAGGTDDSIDLSAYDGTGVTWTVDQAGANTVFNFSNGDSITLLGVNSGDLIWDGLFGYS